MDGFPVGGFPPHQPGFPPLQLPGALPQLHGAGPQAGFPPQLHGFPPHVAAQFHAHPDPLAVCPLLRVTRLRDAERDQQQLLYALMVHRQRQVTQCAASVPVEVGWGISGPRFLPCGSPAAADGS